MQTARFLIHIWNLSSNTIVLTSIASPSFTVFLKIYILIKVATTDETYTNTSDKTENELNTAKKHTKPSENKWSVLERHTSKQC